MWLWHRLLWIYALATALYALANVVVNYRLSAGNSKGTWFALGAGRGPSNVAIITFHESLQQVILVQVVLMAGLLGTPCSSGTWRLVQRRSFLRTSLEVSPNS